jgi:zinc transport system permease protein
METLRVDLLGYLFGDILAVTWTDVAWTVSGSMLALAVLALIWRPLLALTVHEDLARVEGVAIGPTRLAYMLLMAIVIAAAMKVVGIILVTSLLIIPAAAARPLARSPEAMAAGASAFGGLAVASGLGGSFAWDLPAGPAIVVAALLLFIAAQAAPLALRRSPVA